MSYSDKRRHEDFRETLRKNVSKDLWNDERVMSDATLARLVDDDALTKCRLSRYGQQSRQIASMTQRTDDYNDMQKARDSWRPADVKMDARDFDLDQNLALIYYEAFGEGFSGEPFPSKDTEYTCRGCGLKMQMSIKLLPERCPTCGRETPLGELIKEGVLRR